MPKKKNKDYIDADYSDIVECFAACNKKLKRIKFEIADMMGRKEIEFLGGFFADSKGNDTIMVVYNINNILFEKRHVDIQFKLKDVEWIKPNLTKDAFYLQINLKNGATINISKGLHGEEIEVGLENEK